MCAYIAMTNKPANRPNAKADLRHRSLPSTTIQQSSMLPADLLRKAAVGVLQESWRALSMMPR